jgi:hypothetical protein
VILPTILVFAIWFKAAAEAEENPSLRKRAYFSI